MTSLIASCIMPTRDRRAFVPEAIRCFLAQDYEPRELIVLDDGADSVGDCIPDDPRIQYVRLERALSLGAKRNALCQRARGEIILHWDDDDWYPAWRTRRQVEALQTSHAAVSGTSTHYFQEPSSGRAWRYEYVGGEPYVTGATLSYRKSFWQTRPFADVQVGEDTQFVKAAPRGSVFDLALPSLCVSTIHAHNVSPKWPVGPAWTSVDPAVIRALFADPLNDGAIPTASCIMPTSDRRPFIPLTLELFAAQEAVAAELIVVDSGRDAVQDLCQGAAKVRYVRAPHGISIGAQRNLACAQARGELIVHWDDDDWYAPQRLLRQIEPIAAGRADVTGLENRYTLSLVDGSFWTTSAELHRRMFVGNIHGGTLAYRRSLLARGVRYEDRSLAEDAALLNELLRGGARLERVANDGVFVYVRHGRNAWQFETGSFVDPAGWSRTERPSTMPGEMLARYRAIGSVARTSNAGARPALLAAASGAITQSLDCLGNTRLGASAAPIELERCVALVATEAHASLLEGALASLTRCGGLPDVPRIVFINEGSQRCEAIAQRHGAKVLPCRWLHGHAPSIKGVLYSLARLVKAKQYLCLDTDVLVMDTLAPLFERHAALVRGQFLVAPEAAPLPSLQLRDALASIYRSTPLELARLLDTDRTRTAHALTLNDGLFVADFQGLSSLDAVLRGDEAIRSWVNARPDVWWRQKGAFNLALARLGAITPLEIAYNAQLHVAPAIQRKVQGRLCADWQGTPAKVLHFNGQGRSAYPEWRAAFESMSG